ncbi:hypothetical protein [Pseudomonas nitroreducens]|uniref:hypothetical protein n=1 Tax=Pseudomonas nitroreducens TaxID=46680 RepID=UPI0011320089|nr:hypothetical protein [Pseudomonas nitroreducens]
MKVFLPIFSLILFVASNMTSAAGSKYIEFPHQAISAELNGKRAIVFFVRNRYSKELNSMDEKGHVNDVDIYSVPQEGGEVSYAGPAPVGNIISAFFFISKYGDKYLYVLSSEDGRDRGVEGRIFNAMNYSMSIIDGRLVVRDYPGDLQYFDLNGCFDGRDLDTGKIMRCPFHDAQTAKNYLKNLEQGGASFQGLDRP